MSVNNALLGLRLNQIDEVSTSVLEHYCGDWTHLRRLTAKSDAPCLEALNFSVDVSTDESGRWDARVIQRLLIDPSWREFHRFKDQFNARNALRGSQGEPAELAQRNVVLRLEPQDVCLEPERMVLIFDQDARECDLHSFSTVVVA